MSDEPITINRAEMFSRQLGPALRKVGVAATDEQVASALVELSREMAPMWARSRDASDALLRTPSERESVRKAIREGGEDG